MTLNPGSAAAAAGSVRPYPHVGHGGWGVEELSDDVGGGGDAEHNGSEDLLPPGQQQHRVLPPATLTSFPVSLYQADRSAAFLPVTLAVGEVVPVVCGEERSEFSAARWVPGQQALQYFIVVSSGSYHRGTEGWTGLRCCIHHGRTCHCSDTCQIHQIRPGLVSEMENLCQGQDESVLISTERGIKSQK